MLIILGDFYSMKHKYKHVIYLHVEHKVLLR
jgi:hypothetical protein